MLVYAFALEFMVGLLIGFLLCDQQKGFSLFELQLGSISIVVTGIYMLCVNSAITWLSLLLLFCSWLAFCAGMFTGEVVRIRAVKALHNEDIQTEMTEFVTHASMAAATGEKAAIETMQEKRQRLLRDLDKAIRNRVVVNKKSRERLTQVKNLANSLAEYTTEVASTKATDRHADVAAVEQIGIELSAISSQTLQDNNHPAFFGLLTMLNLYK